MNLAISLLRILFQQVSEIKRTFCNCARTRLITLLWLSHFPWLNSSYQVFFNCHSRQLHRLFVFSAGKAHMLFDSFCKACFWLIHPPLFENFYRQRQSTMRNFASEVKKRSCPTFFNKSPSLSYLPQPPSPQRCPENICALATCSESPLIKQQRFRGK